MSIKEIDRIRECVNSCREVGVVNYMSTNNEQIINSALDRVKEILLDLDDISDYLKNRITLVGILQSLYIQQDAVFALYKIFKSYSKTINIFFDDNGYCKLKDIRFIRNSTLGGHPVESGIGKKLCYMGYIEPFEYDTWIFKYQYYIRKNNSGGDLSFHKNNLKDLISEQCIEIIKILKTISDTDIKCYYKI